MSELNIKIRKLQDNGSTFRATPESLYMGGVGSAKVDTLCFDVPEEWKGCAITLHVQRLSGTLPDPQLLDEKNRAVVDQRWTKEKQGLWMLMAVGADGYTAMTKPGRYTCYETIDRDSTTEDITPSVYEQFVALVKKETAEANRAAKNAAASAEIAKNFESTITATGEQVQREITATADQTKQAIDEKAKAALASIPEDYTELSESVGQLKEDLVDLRTSIDVFESEETVNTTINTNGRYWDTSKTNSWGTHNEYAVTNIVLFTKGTTIAFKAYGEPGVAFFVETTSPTSLNQKTTGISLNFEQTGYLEGKYTFEANTPISFSYKTTNEFYVNIVEKTNKVVEYYGKVDDLENSINYIPMFRNIGIVGDSLSSGEIAYSDESGNHYVDRFDSSWLSIVGRNNGVNVSHYSQGGMTTKAWLENAGNKKTSLLADDSKNAYFVALGTNDISESYPLGNVSDTSSTDSFVGYLKNIIDVVHTKSPNAVVFLVSTYNNSDNGIRYSNMISEIADLYEYCFFVDFVNHTDIYTSTGGVWSNLGHFTSLGYVKVAKIIEKLLNKIVDENKNYFKFFTLNN